MEIIRRHFPTIDSTNNWGKEHAHEFPHDKITLITADTQTAGRGRFKRKWESPPSQNIYATFCFFIEKDAKNIGNIPQILAISAAEILKKLNFNPRLKWPNDVLISDKKVAGILAETTVVGRMCMVLGIGLNVNMPPEILYKIDRPATSLMVESGRSFDKEMVLKELQDEFLKNLEIFFSKGFTPFLEIYRQYMPKDPNKILRFHDNMMIWEGILHDINQDGSLRLKLSNGELKTFIAGEILWPGE
ncbi:MAG TPA: biotin--[acetyl-CoA-carboxylase] ligase [Parachlamydiaceae bacterium]|nr:biotin--[acetyl-CoA-carboxylase] ligase [Parachlamydiaceae bacterium]